VRDLQIALGHSSLATTQTYLQSIGCAEVVDEAARREW
jgi:site-specific recombinase XerC